MTEKVVFWYNHKTRSHDPICSKIDDYSCYLPQIISAQGLYECYIETGLKPIDAFLKVAKKIADFRTTQA